MNNIVAYTFYNWLIETGDLGKGKGLWSAWHFIFMTLLTVWLIVCWFVFKKHKKLALKVTKITCIIMLSFRIARMLLLMISGKETVVQALPWHLCHIMAIVFPIMFLTNTKKFFLPILCVTLFGGILTFIFGDYYTYSVFSFLQLESLFLHFCMPTVVIGVVASGWFKPRFEDLWQVPIFLVMLMSYAEIGNTLVPGSNYLYLRQNGLPFTLFNIHFYFTYLILVLTISILFISFMALPSIIKNRKNKKFRHSVRENLEL